MSALFDQRLGSLAAAFDDFDSTLPPANRSDDAPIGPAAPAPIAEALIKRMQQAAITSAQGIPAQFNNCAWAWAGAWVAQNGVTLPPDTSEYRSLRNWFCYQVSMFKKSKLSERSRLLLAKHGIDLAQYRAPNTGRGTLIDDKGMVTKLQIHLAISGSYDLDDECDAELLEWQARLIEVFRRRGTSNRLRTICALLPDFEMGMWRRPGEMAADRAEREWFAMAVQFRAASRVYPAFRGAMDPRTPPHLFAWGFDQIVASRDDRLTTRQTGELKALGLIDTGEHAINKTRQAVLSQTRAESNNWGQYGTRERDLCSFLGTSLLIRMLSRNAPLLDIYAELSISPMDFVQIEQSLATTCAKITRLADFNTLTEARNLYLAHSVAFDRAVCIDELPEYVFEDLRKGRQSRTTQLVACILETRETMRCLNIWQDLAPVVPAPRRMSSFSRSNFRKASETRATA